MASEQVEAVARAIGLQFMIPVGKRPDDLERWWSFVVDDHHKRDFREMAIAAIAAYEAVRVPDRVQFEGEFNWTPHRPCLSPSGGSGIIRDTLEEVMACFDRARKNGPLCRAVVKRLDITETEVYRERGEIDPDIESGLGQWVRDELAKPTTDMRARLEGRGDE